MSRLDAVDERRHVPGRSSAWTETWEWRLADPDAGLAVSVTVIRRPGERCTSYLASVLGPDRRTVSVIEHDVVEPTGGLELRASGLWADHVCEVPFDHWSAGLEAFGLELDDPADAVGSGLGHRIPVGLDLEWEDAGGSEPPLEGDDGYLRWGRAHGEVLVGAAVIDVDGAGHRLHRWGTGARLPAWWGAGSEVGLGPAPHEGPGRVLARALADDADGEVVEWRHVTGAPPALVSSPRR